MKTTFCGFVLLALAFVGQTSVSAETKPVPVNSTSLETLIKAIKSHLIRSMHSYLVNESGSKIGDLVTSSLNGSLLNDSIAEGIANYTSNHPYIRIPDSSKEPAKNNNNTDYVISIEKLADEYATVAFNVLGLQSNDMIEFVTRLLVKLKLTKDITDTLVRKIETYRKDFREEVYKLVTRYLDVFCGTEENSGAIVTDPKRRAIINTVKPGAQHCLDQIDEDVQSVFELIKEGASNLIHVFAKKPLKEAKVLEATGLAFNSWLRTISP